ncbi:Resolvase%2C N terminal domain [Serratia marcescens]|uniref:recombinase family protein n=1 Tax=Serratia marcescens TaxID=615 RepID=UPI0007450CA1|nr:recombinase family protein [Serratia marcescens]CVF89739.1 Resolvase%2C N terminal domain [Serratia marcescens]
MTKRKIYSYVRWSSDRQSKGTSLERQTAKAKEFAHSHNLELVELLDAGLSAYRGKNTTQGALGGFIQAVESGAIPNDSYLFVENLDRLSRQDILTANKLFSHLLELGLTVVTGMDGRIYTRQSVTANPTDLMLSILLFSRANEESATKQKRVYGNIAALVERHKAGLPTTIKTAGSHVWWVDASGDKHTAVQPHPTLWKAARKAVELFLDGYSAHAVCDYLNEHYDAPPVRVTKSTNNPDNLGKWSYPLLRRMKTSRTLIGERTINAGDITYTLENYYPALCSPTEFALLQDLNENNKLTQGPKKTRITLLSGLGVLKCGHCGGAMTFMIGTKGKIRYMCANGKDRIGNCKAWSIGLDILERTLVPALVRGYMDYTLGGNAKGDDIKESIQSAQEALQAIESQIENITNAITLGGNLAPLVERMGALSKVKDSQLLEVERLNRLALLSESESGAIDKITDFILQIRPNVLTDLNHPLRLQLREAVRAVIESCTIHKREDRGLAIVYTIKGSPFRTVHAFVAANRGHYKETVLNIGSDDQPLPDVGDSQKFDDAITKIVDQMGLPPIDGGLMWARR